MVGSLGQSKKCEINVLNNWNQGRLFIEYTMELSLPMITGTNYIRHTCEQLFRQKFALPKAQPAPKPVNHFYLDKDRVNGMSNALLMATEKLYGFVPFPPNKSVCWQLICVLLMENGMNRSFRTLNKKQQKIKK